MESLIYEAVNTYIVTHNMYKMYNVSINVSINVITETCTSDTCFAIHMFLAATTYPARCNNLPRVTVDRAWVTSHINLTTIRNINCMVHFIHTNNECTVYAEITHVTYFSQKKALTDNLTVISQVSIGRFVRNVCLYFDWLHKRQSSAKRRTFEERLSGRSFVQSKTKMIQGLLSCGIP